MQGHYVIILDALLWIIFIVNWQNNTKACLVRKIMSLITIIKIKCEIMVSCIKLIEFGGLLSLWHIPHFHSKFYLWNFCNKTYCFLLFLFSLLLPLLLPEVCECLQYKALCKNKPIIHEQIWIRKTWWISNTAHHSTLY